MFDTVSITHSVIIQLGRAGGPKYRASITNNKNRYPVPADESLIRIVSETDS